MLLREEMRRGAMMDKEKKEIEPTGILLIPQEDGTYKRVPSKMRPAEEEYTFTFDYREYKPLEEKKDE